MILILLLLLALILCCILLKYHYEYWTRLAVPGPKPYFLIGNLGSSLLFKKSLGDIVTEIYKDYSHAPLVGIFRATSPALIIRDPDIIKDITVKDFRYFHDNDVYVETASDPLLGRTPFFLKAKQWKIVRSQLTPCFTSGKMKALYPMLDEISRNFVEFIDRQIDLNCKDGLEAKELCTKFTLNNVASCAFGLEGRCFEDSNSEFREIAKAFLSPAGWSSLMFILATLIPDITKFVNIKFMKKDVEERLITVTTEALKYRKENNIERNDFLQFISRLKETSKDYKFTDIDICAHAVGFFIDGYETSSIVMSFFLYHLANNPEAQNKLRREIDVYHQNNGGKLNYESVWKMPYLDAAFNESLRIHPVVLTGNKICTETYTFKPRPGIEKPITIEKGTPLLLPTMGLHMDPKYFPNPESFIPERFLNKQDFNRYTYLPFGEGPRACLGQRFGVLQIKVGTAYIIKNFELSVNKRTQQPLKLDPLYFLVSPIGGLWIDFKRRKQN